MTRKLEIELPDTLPVEAWQLKLVECIDHCRREAVRDQQIKDLGELYLSVAAGRER